MPKPKKNVSPSDSGSTLVLKGGSGDDLYVVHDSDLKISERRNGGHDTVEAHVDFTLSEWVEDLVLKGDSTISGTGNDLDNSIIGNAADNQMKGMAGDDYFRGGGGIDTIDGGTGTDTVRLDGTLASYSIEESGDTITLTLASDPGGTAVTAVNVEIYVFDDCTLTHEELTELASRAYDPSVPQAPDTTVPVESHILDALLPPGGEDNDARWNAGAPLGSAVVVTYSFLESTPDYYSAFAAERVGFMPFTEEQKAVALQAMADIAGYTNVVFVEAAAEDAQITFGTADFSGGAGWAYLPGSTDAAGDVWIDNQVASNMDLAPGGDGYMTIYHEIGHAMGLEHPHEGIPLPAPEDTRQFTMMSYLEHTGTAGIEPSSYMLYDIAALQYLYGTGTGGAGDSTYIINSAESRVFTIWDSGGHDAIDASASAGDVVIDLEPGAFSSAGTAHGWLPMQSNIAIAFGTVIEDALGGVGNDRLLGNDADNRLTGGGGNDELTGRAGSDAFVFTSDWGSDVVTDFEVGVDTLHFQVTGLTMDDLDLSQTSDGVLVSSGSGEVLLLNVELDSISNAVFFFDEIA